MLTQRQTEYIHFLLLPYVEGFYSKPRDPADDKSKQGDNAF